MISVIMDCVFNRERESGEEVFYINYLPPKKGLKKRKINGLNIKENRL